MLDYDAELDRGDVFNTPISIRTKDKKRLVYDLKKASDELFSRWKETLFIAEYCPGSTGGVVAAIDLSTSKQLWKSRLQAIGFAWGSKYSNHGVNIETDGEKVIIYGNESNGKYVEHLDIKSGKMLLNKKFDRSTKSS